MKDPFTPVILSAVLLTAACSDIRRQIIPNALILSAVTARFLLYIPALICQEISVGDILVDAAFSVLFPVILFLIAGRIVPNGIGMGDIKLMIVIALYLDFRISVTAFLYSFLLAAAVGLFRLVIMKQKTIRLPLAPAFLIGTLLALFIRF